MIYRTILLLFKKYLWSTFLKRAFKTKLLHLLYILAGVFALGVLAASFVFDLTLEQGVYFVWGYVEDLILWVIQMLIQI